jgi:NAD(P)-dependent dehydrogenase (short-subunit alcohol dehydrogenase family)
MERKVCVIVGAGNSLGQSLGRTFAKAGFNIGLISRSQQGSAVAFEAASAINDTQVRLWRATRQNPKRLNKRFLNFAASWGDWSLNLQRTQHAD